MLRLAHLTELESHTVDAQYVQQGAVREAHMSTDVRASI